MINHPCLVMHHFKESPWNPEIMEVSMILARTWRSSCKRRMDMFGTELPGILWPSYGSWSEFWRSPGLHIHSSNNVWHKPITMFQPLLSGMNIVSNQLSTTYIKLHPKLSESSHMFGPFNFKRPDRQQPWRPCGLQRWWSPWLNDSCFFFFLWTMVI